ncbi:rhamnogalacturonan lyase family protein [Acrocarpospora phusangensis]|uniref:rhamnogalacturonan lyase family protein n=1 Tax=Acrocarpospora phusangensis TaxID=1070424 RepID=UPI0035A21E85
MGRPTATGRHRRPPTSTGVLPAQKGCTGTWSRSANRGKQNTAYNQPPHPSFFIGDGMATPAKPNVYVR